MIKGKTVPATIAIPCLIANLPTNAKRAMINNELSSGKFCTITFTKKNGDLRQINCRLGVKKHLKDGKKTSNGSSNTVRHIKKYVTVFETGKKGGYKNIDLDSVHKMTSGGEVFNFVG